MTKDLLCKVTGICCGVEYAKEAESWLKDLMSIAAATEREHSLGKLVGPTLPFPFTSKVKKH